MTSAAGTATAAELIASYVADAPPAASDELVMQVRRAFLDTYASAAAAVPTEAHELIVRYGRRTGGSGAATIWFAGGRTDEVTAALVNGTTSHILDYDDSSRSMNGHPSAAMLAALVAVAETLDCHGADLVMPYAVGFEVMAKIGLAIAPDHFRRGWHLTSTIGTIGAVAGVARLLGLSAPQVKNALGIAMAQVGGVRQNFGTMSKGLQAGTANATAVRAVLLASDGFTGGHGVLDADGGSFASLYGAPAHAQLRAQLAELGDEPIELLRTGLDFKRFPACLSVQRAIDAATEIRDRAGLVPEDITAVRVRTHERGMHALIYADPLTADEGRFSMQFSVAAALTPEGASFEAFSDEFVQRPDVRRLVGLVDAREAGAHERPELSGPEVEKFAVVEVDDRAGTTHRSVAALLPGSAKAPLTHAQLARKVSDCLAHAAVDIDGATLVDLVERWDDVPVAELVAARAGAESQGGATT